jgi:hypothetical protein
MVQKGSISVDTCLQTNQDLKWWYFYSVFMYTVFDKILIMTKTGVTDQYVLTKHCKLTTWKEIVKILRVVN